MICHTNAADLNDFDMTDGARSIINFQPDSGSSSYKFKCASVKNIFKKVNDFFVCIICNKKFTQKSDHQNHMRTHEKHESPTYSCNICNKSFAVPARLTRHYRTHTGEKPYQCEYCTKSFSVKENLSVHRRIHTKERPYRCDVCQSGFEHSGKLHRHMRIHTGERPHKCSICDKTFIQSGQLVIHMRTHTGEKPYICKLCGKGFTCSKQLKVHTRTHTGEKPYRCDVCGKSFGYNHVLKLHQVAHYGEKFYKCILCQMSFNSKKLMEMHMKSPLNCKVYDAAKLNSTTSQTIDIINEILPCNGTHPKCIIEGIANKKHIESKQLEEKSVSYEIYSMNKKKNPLLHYESYQNNSKNPIRISQQKLASDIIIPYRIENPQSFPLFCQHSAIDDDKFDSDPHELKEYTFITPVTPSKVPSFYSNLEEKTLTRPIEKENLSAHKKLTMCYENISQVHTMNSLLHKSGLNIIIPNSRDDSSLTPQKRCKVVSESILPEKFGYETSMRCNSVIKFAKTDRMI